jgi:Flp pilus assembly protein TadB
MNIAKRIYLPQTIKKYQVKIAALGPNNNISVANFLLSRSFISLLLFLSLLLIPSYGLIWAIIIVFSFYISYTYFLIDVNISKRKNELYEEALNFFELVRLSLNDTNDLRKSLLIVAKNNDSSIAKDFLLSLQKNEYNNNIRLVLQDMINKIPNEDVKIALIDLTSDNNYSSTLDNIITKLKLKNKYHLTRKYQALPYILSVICLIIIILIILIIVYLPNILNML